MSAAEATIDTLLATGKRVRVDPGTPVQLEINGVAGRLSSRVVGMDPGRFLIVTLPNCGISIQSKLYRGNTVVLRYLYEGNAVAFQSSLLAASSEPAKLLFLGCPKVIAQRSVRAEQRVDCRLPATLNAFDGEYAAVVLDLSMAGAQCVLRPGDGVPPTLSKDTGVELRVQIPGQSGEVVMRGTVRGPGEDGEPCGVGVAFDEPEPAAAESLRRYLATVA